MLIITWCSWTNFELFLRLLTSISWRILMSIECERSLRRYFFQPIIYISLDLLCWILCSCASGILESNPFYFEFCYWGQILFYYLLRLLISLKLIIFQGWYHIIICCIILVRLQLLVIIALFLSEVKNFSKTSDWLIFYLNSHESIYSSI